MGEQSRPALDVPGEAEDEVGRRGDVDPDRAPHAAPRRRPGRRRARPRTGRVSTSRTSPSSSRPEPARGVGRAVDLVAEPAADDPHLVEDAEEVEIGALGGARLAVDVGEDPRDRPRSRRRGRSPPRARGSTAASGCSPNWIPPPGSVHAPTSTSIADSRARRIRPSSSDAERVAAERGSGRRRDDLVTPRGGHGLGHGRRRPARKRGSKAARPERGRPSRGPSSHGPGRGRRAAGRRSRRAAAGRGTPGRGGSRASFDRIRPGHGPVVARERRRRRRRGARSIAAAASSRRARAPDAGPRR